jgi:hypothetical protein
MGLLPIYTKFHIIISAAFMNPIRLQIQNNENIGIYIPDFSTDKVVLKNYFYFTPNNFLTSDLYSDEELGVILQLTDTEYAQLVQNYFGKSVVEDTQNNEQKILELEAKLSKSREYEEKSTKVQTLQKELDELKKNLSSVDDIQKKYQECLDEYKQYESLSKYNLAKIHEDLVANLNDINNLEQKVLNHKGAQIRESYTRVSYDKGKIGLSVGLIIGITLLGVILKLLETPNIVIGIGVGVGILLCLLILYSAKTEIEYGGGNMPETESIEGINTQLELLKQRRAQILQIVGVNDSDEFFNKKAKLTSIQKSMSYLAEQRNRAIEGSDYNELKSKESALVNEIENIKNLLSDTSVLLKPEEYLSIRREVDYLKLSTNQAKQMESLQPEDIKNKLQLIKQELKDKLPEFCNVLKNTLVSSLQRIDELKLEYCNKYNIEAFAIDENLTGFENLSSIQKLVLELSLFKIIYEADFVFMLPNTSTWDVEVQNLLSSIVTETEEKACSFYFIN